MNKQQNIGFALLMTGLSLSRYNGTVLSVLGVALSFLGLLLAFLDSCNVSKGFAILGLILAQGEESSAFYIGLVFGIIGILLLIWNGKSKE